MQKLELSPRGKAIDFFMLEVGFDLPKLLQISGINAGTMSKINRGVSSPTEYTMERIAKALGIKHSDIVLKKEELEK